MEKKLLSDQNAVKKNSKVVSSPTPPESNKNKKEYLLFLSNSFV